MLCVPLYIGRNVVENTIKMKTIVRKLLMINKNYLGILEMNDILVKEKKVFLGVFRQIIKVAYVKIKIMEHYQCYQHCL